jgi:hypothetical protein
MATLRTNKFSPSEPLTYAVSPDGVLYMANGIDAPQRWDGQTASAETAGIVASTASCQVSASGSGDIYGTYHIYTRFLDDAGVPSSFSSATTIAITSGASCETLNYTEIPLSTESRVTEREVWRNTAGQLHTYYRDCVIDDNETQVTSSTRTDGDLVTQSSIRLLTEDGWPNANRFYPPPSWMKVVVSFGNRMWYLVPADYTDGTATIDEATVTGTATRWTQQMLNRRLYIAGKLAGTIESLTTSSITLTESPSDGFGSGSYYAIGDDDERNRVHFSEDGEPESFPKDTNGNYTNVVQLQEDGDRLTGGMALGSYLYLLKEAHIYRLSTAGDPRRDANVALVAERGCLNQRTCCRVEGVAFMMDRSGIYVFQGTTTEAISGPVQDYFRGRINWDVSKWFHAAASADEELVYFYVALDGDLWPKSALVFNYRLQQWYEDSYPFWVGCSGIARINGERRIIAGSENTVVLMNQGILDGLAPYADNREDSVPEVTETVRGTVTWADSNTISDNAADFSFSNWHADPTDVGAPVTVIDSNGDYQTRRIASITGSAITVQDAWASTPSVGDTYQIGAIEYQAKFGSFRFLEREQENRRGVRLIFEPQTEDGKVNIRRYLNHSSTPYSDNYPHDDEIGGEVTRDSANFQVDLTQAEGMAFQRFDGHIEDGTPSARVVEIELKGVSGKERAKFYQLDVEGVR